MIAFILLQATETLSALKIHNVAQPKLTFFELLIKGGPILIPIGILSIISIYIIAEKFFAIHNATTASKKLRNDFKNSITKNNTEESNSILKSEKGAYSTIFLQLIKYKSSSVSEIEKEIESVSNIEVSKMNRNLTYLGLIAGIAPMLGFIGTISGIIKIFYNISVTDNISIGVISAGLYEKMISSGSGLIVGVIAYTGYHLLNSKIDNFISLVESDSFEVLETIKDANKNI